MKTFQRIVALLLTFAVVQDTYLTADAGSLLRPSYAHRYEFFENQAIREPTGGYRWPILKQVAIRFDQAIKQKTRMTGRSAGITVIEWSGADMSTIGGLESYIGTLERSLLAHEPIRIHNLFPVNEKSESKELREGSKITHGIYIPTKSRLMRHLNYGFRFYARTKQIILRERGDGRSIILHLHTPHNLSFSAATLLLSLKYRIPRVATSHASITLFPWRGYLSAIAIIIVPLFGIGSFLTGVSRSATRLFFQPAEFIASEVDLSIFTRSPGQAERFFSKYENYGVDSGRQILFYPARISHEKGHLDLLYLAQEIKRNNIRAQIVFMGEERKPRDKPFLGKVKQLIDTEKLGDYVCILPEGNSEDVRDGLAAAKVLVFPSPQEGLGLISLEAQAMEVPVAAYDIEGLRESLGRGAGILTEAGNRDAFVKSIFYLLQLSEVDRTIMGAKGRAFVETKYSLETFTQQHLSLYHRISSWPNNSDERKPSFAAHLRQDSSQFLRALFYPFARLTWGLPGTHVPKKSVQIDFENDAGIEEPAVLALARSFLDELNPILHEITSERLMANYPAVCSTTASMAMSLLNETFDDLSAIILRHGKRFGIEHYWLELSMAGRYYFLSFTEGQWEYGRRMALWRLLHGNAKFLSDYHRLNLDDYRFVPMGSRETFYQRNDFSDVDFHPSKPIQRPVMLAELRTRLQERIRYYRETQLRQQA